MTILKTKLLSEPVLKPECTAQGSNQHGLSGSSPGVKWQVEYTTILLYNGESEEQ